MSKITNETDSKKETQNCFKFTSSVFPPHHEGKEEAGIPWGGCFQPYASVDGSGLALVSASTHGIHSSDVPRCLHCYAYINPFANFYGRSVWKCPLCRSRNNLSSSGLRSVVEADYKSPDKRPSLPSLGSSWIEYEHDEDDGEKQNAGYLFLVDVAGNQEDLEVIRSALLAAVEALSLSNPNHYVALALFAQTLGVFQLSSPQFPLLRVSQLTDEGSVPPLSDVIPIRKVFSPISKCRDALCSAIDTFDPRQLQQEMKIVQDAEKEDKNKTKESIRAFGPAALEIHRFLSQSHSFIRYCRVITILTGIPNQGIGALQSTNFIHSFGEDETVSLLKPHSSFYHELARDASRLGQCWDMFALSNLRYLDIPSLQFLPRLSGGTLCLYDTNDTCLMPHDIYRHLCTPHCFGGFLRLRCSSAFEPNSIRGSLIPHEKYPNLYCIAGCDCHRTFSVTFKFSSISGFDYDSKYAFIQLAFAYSAFMKQNHDQQDEKIQHLSRRLRVLTLRVKIASCFEELFKHVNPEVTISVILHQSIALSLNENIREARILLQDWLIKLVAGYARKYANIKARDLTANSLDTVFDRCLPLRWLPRFVFAILKNPAFATGAIHPDLRVFYHALFLSLPIEHLSKAIYPALSSWKDCEEMDKDSLFLSRSCLMSQSTSTSPILFLLDSFHSLVVYYTRHTLDSDNNNIIKFPPPHGSYLRNRIIQLQKQTPYISPKIIFAQEGSAEARYFFTGLLEEEDAGTGGFSFEDFDKNIMKLAADLIKAKEKGLAS